MRVRIVRPSHQTASDYTLYVNDFQTLNNPGSWQPWAPPEISFTFHFWHKSFIQQFWMKKMWHLVKISDPRIYAGYALASSNSVFLKNISPSARDAPYRLAPRGSCSTLLYSNYAIEAAAAAAWDNPSHGTVSLIMPPPQLGGGIKRCFCLTSDVLSVAYIGTSREQRGL